MPSIKVIIPEQGTFSYEYDDKTTVKDCCNYFSSQTQIDPKNFVLINYAKVLSNDILIKDIDFSKRPFLVGADITPDPEVLERKKLLPEEKKVFAEKLLSHQIPPEHIVDIIHQIDPSTLKTVHDLLSLFRYLQIELPQVMQFFSNENPNTNNEEESNVEEEEEVEIDRTFDDGTPNNTFSDDLSAHHPDSNNEQNESNEEGNSPSNNSQSGCHVL